MDQNGWLVPSQNTHDGIIPLMCVKQESKNKVRPVMDYSELNQYVMSHTMESAAIDQSLRTWRQKSKNCKLLDLKDAYLQLYVDQDLWKFQEVVVKGTRYQLTRLGFGLVCAPKIMSKVLDFVLEANEKVRKGVDHYVDDIIVDEDVVSVDEVIDHLSRYGLICKEPESLKNAHMLGLRVFEKHGELLWKRNENISELCDKIIFDQITKEQLHSICRKLVSHFPVCGWLRVACTNTNTNNGKDVIYDRAKTMFEELMIRVAKDDPARSAWNAKKEGQWKVWCDASRYASGCVIECDGKIIEDGSWLRKENDNSHINVAELEAVIKGLNLVLKWNPHSVEIVTDSQVFYGWLLKLMSKENKIKINGLNEMLVRRRLSIISSTIDECNLSWSCKWIPSEKNISDRMTRVKKAWLSDEVECSLMIDKQHKMGKVKEHHNKHHGGFDKTLYLLQKSGITATEEVRRVIKECHECNSVDPAPIRMIRRGVSVNDNWKRLAIDHVHYKASVYISMVDCGPSRFAIWRLVGSQSAQNLVNQCNHVFSERGPPEEVWVDNSTTFRSMEFKNMCAEWGVSVSFRCAYKPGTNGIVERNHRSVKRIAERAKIPIWKAVYWYNISPMGKKCKEGVPSNLIYKYEVKLPEFRKVESNNIRNSFVVGDAVYVKPKEHVRCDERWQKGVIEKVISTTCVEVNGMPRHVQDVRRRYNDEADTLTHKPIENVNDDRISISTTNSDESDVDSSEEDTGLRRSTRIRSSPKWKNDYELG